MKFHTNAKVLLLICAALLLALLVVYGRDSDSYRTYSNYIINGEPQTLTLTMSAPYMYVPALRRAEILLNRTMNQDSGNSFRLELTVYGDRDNITASQRETHRQRFNMMLMAGEAYDLFLVDRHPLWHYARSGFLANIYDMIDQDPTVSRNDFFANVLEAYEYQGQLISIPMKFGFTYVGINYTLPHTFIDRFIQYETISYSTLLDMYRDLKLAHPGEFDHLAFATYGKLHPYILFEFAISNYINSTTRTASLTNTSFINFLESLYFAASNLRVINPDCGTYYPINRLDGYEMRINGFVFSTLSDALLPWSALFEMEHPIFLNYIPVADKSGRLMIGSGFWWHEWHGPYPAIAVSVGANQDLAWEYIKALITVLSCVDAIGAPFHYFPLSFYSRFGSLRTSINARQFHERTEYSFGRISDWRISIPTLPRYLGQGDPDAHQQQIANAIARLERYNAMPVMTRNYLPAAIWPIYEDMMDGIITPYDAAHRLQNLISLWLIE